MENNLKTNLTYVKNYYIASILGSTNIYPVTVYEMSEVLKILIDEYRRQTYSLDSQKNMRAIVSQIKFFKREDPQIFRGSKKYLRTKRLKLLKRILGSKF